MKIKFSIYQLTQINCLNQPIILDWRQRWITERSSVSNCLEVTLKNVNVLLFLQIYALCGTYIGLGVLALLVLSLLLDNVQTRKPSRQHLPSLRHEEPNKRSKSKSAMSKHASKMGVVNQALEVDSSYQLDDFAYRSDPNTLRMAAYLGWDDGNDDADNDDDDDDDDIWYSKEDLTETAGQHARCPGCPSCSDCCRLLFATFHHLRHGKQILLIPLTIYSGLEQAFLAGEFTKVSIMLVCS